MKSKFVFIICFILVTINIIMGWYLPPYGITLTPLVIITLTLLIVFITKLKLVIKSLIITVLVILNDIGIKLFSGGTSDWEGLGWIQLMFFIGIVPSYGIILINLLINRKSKMRDKLIASIILPLGVIVDLLFLTKIGLK